MADTTPKLPRNATNGTEVADIYGNIWKFHAPSKSWINNGAISSIPEVTEETDGLVYPDLFAKLETLKAASVDADFGLFKIYPAIDSYWYRFLSHNKTVKFTVENRDTIRIEVDRVRLVQALSYHKCFGPKGLKGKTGVRGRDGIAGKHETVYTPIITDNVLAIEAGVITEIDTPVSFRLFRSGKLILEIYFGLDGTNVEKTNTLKLDWSDITLSDNVLRGNIVISDTAGTWAYRVGQVGNKGPKGEDGHEFFVVKDLSVDEKFISPVVLTLIRRGDGNNLYSSIVSTPTTSCVSKLSFIPAPCSDINALGNSAVLSVVPGTQTCKDISLFRFYAVDDKTGLSHAVSLSNPKLLDRPSLDLPEWTPTEACWRQRHWQASKFNWPDLTHVPAEQLLWPEPNTYDIRDPAYPYAIKQDTAPGERCCQDDFFYCANVNDKNYPILGADGGIAQIAAPLQPAACCECDCPIELELQGGYDFVDYIIASDGVVTHCGTGGADETGCQTAVCVLNGSLHTYRQRIFISPQDSETDTEVSFKVGYDDICDDAQNVPRPSGDIPAFFLGCSEARDKTECPVFWTAEIVSDVRDGFVSDGILYKSSSGNKTVKFKFNATQGGIVDIVISVNTTLQDCCLGYYVTTCATAYKSTVTSEGLSVSPSPSSPAGISVSPPAPSNISPSPSAGTDGTDTPDTSPSVWLSPSLSPSLSPFVPNSPPPPSVDNIVYMLWFNAPQLDYASEANYAADRVQWEALLDTLESASTEGIKVRAVAGYHGYPSQMGAVSTTEGSLTPQSATTPGGVITGGALGVAPFDQVLTGRDTPIGFSSNKNLPSTIYTKARDSYEGHFPIDNVISGNYAPYNTINQRLTGSSLYGYNVVYRYESNFYGIVSWADTYDSVLERDPNVIFVRLPNNYTTYGRHRAGPFTGTTIAAYNEVTSHPCGTTGHTVVLTDSNNDEFCVEEQQYDLGAVYDVNSNIVFNTLATRYPDSVIVPIVEDDVPGLRWLAEMTKVLRDRYL